MSLRDKILNAKNKTVTNTRILPYLQEELLKPFPGLSPRKLKIHAQGVIDEVDKGGNSDAINKHILELLFITLSGERKGREYIHPSELKHACPRKVFYDISRSPITNPSSGEIAPKLKLTFDIGHLLHAYIQNKLFKIGVLKESEVDVTNDDLMIGGKADGILVFEGSSDEYVLEVKTINDYGFKSLKAAPIDYHENQASIYGGTLRKNGRPIKGILFLYINKNTSEIKEYLVPINEKEFKEAEEKCLYIVDHYKKEKEPDRICVKHTEELACKCIYKDLCFKIK